jgi:hypothetical protein
MAPSRGITATLDDRQGLHVIHGTAPLSASTADTLELLLKILVDLPHCLIGRAVLPDVLGVLHRWLPMTYRGPQ